MKYHLSPSPMWCYELILDTILLCFFYIFPWTPASLQMFLTPGFSHDHITWFGACVPVLAFWSSGATRRWEGWGVGWEGENPVAAVSCAAHRPDNASDLQHIHRHCSQQQRQSNDEGNKWTIHLTPPSPLSCCMCCARSARNPGYQLSSFWRQRQTTN